MFKEKPLNKIADIGTRRFDRALFQISDCDDPDAIMVRSADMLNYSFNPELLCIARAGAGYNNIPIDRCAKEGIVVFNTPGANSNAVKELVICSLLMCSRDVFAGERWTHTIADKGDEVPALVEKGKSAFAGPEILGKTLGIIGLGAVGAKVAKAANALGMDILGYDPYLPEEVGKELSGFVKIYDDMNEVFKNSDYISLHLPYLPSTKDTINADTLAVMRDGVRILNLARGELVNDDDMLAAISSGKVKAYVADFPNAKAAGVPGIIALPHLGASTPESEDNCAIMAADQISEYILDGNIINSVNYPRISLANTGSKRVVVLHSSSLSSEDIFAAISAAGADITGKAAAQRGEFAATIADTGKLPEDFSLSLDGVFRTRVI